MTHDTPDGSAIEKMTEQAHELFADPVIVAVICSDGYLEINVTGSARKAGAGGEWVGHVLRTVAGLVEEEPGGTTLTPPDVVDR